MAGDLEIVQNPLVRDSDSDWLGPSLFNYFRILKSERGQILLVYSEGLSKCIGIIQFDLISPWKDKHYFYQVMTGLLYTSNSDEQTTLLTTVHTKMDNEDVYAKIKAIRETVTEINFEIAGFKRDLNKEIGPKTFMAFSAFQKVYHNSDEENNSKRS